MNTLKIKVQDTRIIGTRYDESEVEDGWIVVEDFPQELLYDPFNWFYIDGQFIKEDPEDIRKREEEERRIAERNAPVLLQTQYITREDFDLLDAQDDNTLYYIQEEDGSTTMVKGENR